MMDALARIDVDRLPGGPITVTVSGEIDLSNASYLERRLDDAVELSADLVLDLTALTYLDSQGLRVLNRLVERHRSGLVGVTVVAAPGSVAGDLLSITGIAAIVDVVPPPRPPVTPPRGS